jgi:hypothetical protein
VDNTAPVPVVGTITTTGNAGYATNGNTITVPFAVTETGSGVPVMPTVTIGGQAATVTGTLGSGYSASYTFSGTTVTEGAINYAISLADGAGNPGSASGATGITYDRTPPTVSSHGATAGTSYPTLTFSVSDTGSGVATLYYWAGTTTPRPAVGSGAYSVAVTSSNISEDLSSLSSNETFSFSFADEVGNETSQIAMTYHSGGNNYTGSLLSTGSAGYYTSATSQSSSTSLQSSTFRPAASLPSAITSSSTAPATYSTTSAVGRTSASAVEAVYAPASGSQDAAAAYAAAAARAARNSGLDLNPVLAGLSIIGGPQGAAPGDSASTPSSSIGSGRSAATSLAGQSVGAAGGAAGGGAGAVAHVVGYTLASPGQARAAAGNAAAGGDLAGGAAGNAGSQGLDSRDAGGNSPRAQMTGWNSFSTQFPGAGSAGLAVDFPLAGPASVAGQPASPAPSKGNAPGAPGTPGNPIPRTDLWFPQTEAGKKDIGNEDESVS